ncbi:MAG: alpha-L-fucosidase [Planctomycetes bacterium]|nr:alpha-L-fucosidase [Planctomycetota bacterium]
MNAVIEVLLLTAVCPAAEPAYRETWESLAKHPVPEWFADAKFGIYAHWGVYSVPAFGSEWYPRNMYIDGNEVHRHHVATYGDPSVFGYKDFIPMFKAGKFDADAWAEIYAKSGARFAGPVAEHHDGFSMWASRVNRWNVADMGPKRDVVGELVEALRKRGLRIITSFHHAFNIQGYYTAKEGWDTGDPRYGDLYGKFDDPKVGWDRWLAKIEEVIDAYRPDQIWFDFGIAKIPDAYKRRMAAYYYNQEAAWGKPVIITRKGDHLPEGVGVLDIERGKMEGPAPFLWQTDDSVAVNSWCWVRGLQVKPTEELVHELIDIVSKNGVLLLNVCPAADGTIPDDQARMLLAMGKWLKVNGEAIYATRPWLVHGEGPNLFDKGRGFSSSKDAPVAFAGQDIRYTRAKDGKTLYAIAMGWPGGRLVLQAPKIKGEDPGARVRLLGRDGTLPYAVDDAGRIAIDVPDLPPAERPCRFAYAFALSGFRAGVDPFALPDAIALEADRAVLEGDQIRTEEKASGRTNIGFWDRPGDRAHWLVRIRTPGRYLVRAELAAAAGASEVRLKIGDASATFEVPATKNWDAGIPVAGGAISFDRPGVYHAILEAASPDRWKPINVWRIQLAPRRDG